jgi:hypothetical protein
MVKLIIVNDDPDLNIHVKNLLKGVRHSVIEGVSVDTIDLLINPRPDS